MTAPLVTRALWPQASRLGAEPGPASDHQHDAYRHNLEIIRKDPLLQRLLTRWRCIGQADREALASLADGMPNAEDPPCHP